MHESQRMFPVDVVNELRQYSNSEYVYGPYDQPNMIPLQFSDRTILTILLLVND
jgi:hypothetical protein